MLVDLFFYFSEQRHNKQYMYFLYNVFTLIDRINRFYFSKPVNFLVTVYYKPDKSVYVFQTRLHRVKDIILGSMSGPKSD